jgi:23S rRNA (adenine2503-C2)-methyltransferase
MNIIASTGKEEVAIVYIAEFGEGKRIELVESIQPPIPRQEKWVLLVSCMFGCPVDCIMCDAGGTYHGKLTKEQLFAQIDYLVYKRFPDGNVPARQFKIQFARMGEPALNPAVLDVLAELPQRYVAPGLMPSISTVAPRGTQPFFRRLLEIKRELYSEGNFQFQFSLHTTDATLRDHIIPVKKWSFEELADYGEQFYAPGDRKITLNFALADSYPLDPQVLLRSFDPRRYLVKITPLNPTYKAKRNNLSTYIDPQQGNAVYPHVQALQDAGYDVIVSIGDVEESYIGSNCGQYLRKHMESPQPLDSGYTYPVQEL